MNEPTAPSDAPLILLIEDEEGIRRFLRATLTAHGYRVREATTAHQGLIDAGMAPPDIIILDLGLPDGDGVDVARQLRGWTSAPIIVLSARGREQEKVTALDAGADDYLTKPFGVSELLARIRVALRHRAEATADGRESATYECSDGDRLLRVDLVRRAVEIVRDGVAARVRLTPTEFRMLALLARHAGKVLTHQQMLREVWGPTHEGDVQYLRVYAAQLRQKIERDPALPRYLLTEPGVGYRLFEADPPRRG